jgi:hypothetical protein
MTSTTNSPFVETQDTPQGSVSAPEDAHAGSDPNEAPPTPEEERQAELQGAVDADRGRLLRAAYQEATSTLRTNHRDEFEDLYEAAAAKRGVKYERRLSAEQKAERDLQALLEANPALREKITSGQV